MRRFAFTPPVTVATDRLYASVAISPNGEHIAFVAAGAAGKLWVQDLDQQEPRPLEGTEGAVTPFWSPDSEFIAFGAGNELKKVAVRGGPITRICQLPHTNLTGGTWAPDGESIVFACQLPEVLYEVPAVGGTPAQLVSRQEAESAPEEGALANRPYSLPREAGDRVLVWQRGIVEGGIVVEDLETGRRGVLGPGVFPLYAPSGHVVYRPAHFSYELWALPFSIDTLQRAGEPFPIARNARSASIASDGTLVYLDVSGSTRQRLAWLNRQGEKTGEIGQVQESIFLPRLAPDGRRVTVTATENSNQDVWVWDIARAVKTRLSSHPADEMGSAWSPDGKQVAFSSLRHGNLDVFVKQADGRGTAEKLVSTPLPEFTREWSPDGNYFFYVVGHPETGDDIWYLERGATGGGWESHPFRDTPFNETSSTFSPDGRYAAFTADDTGRYEIYVQDFPGGDRTWTVSSNGGSAPKWRGDGKELFYFEGDTLMTVSVSNNPVFSAGTPKRLFTHGDTGQAPLRGYDVTDDGQTFVVVEPAEDAGPPVIRVVENWYEEFRGREQQ